MVLVGAHRVADQACHAPKSLAVFADLVNGQVGLAIQQVQCPDGRTGLGPGNPREACLQRFARLEAEFADGHVGTRGIR